MRSALLLLALITSGGCSEPTESGPIAPVVETAPDNASRTVQLDAEDLELPAPCASLHAPMIVTFGDFESSTWPWLMGSPERLSARAKADPSMRNQAVRHDGLSVHQSGGYLSNPGFTIQCRSTDLMGLHGPNHFVRCRLVDPDLTRVAGFDVPSENADCTGFIAREIQRQLPDFDVSQPSD